MTFEALLTLQPTVDFGKVYANTNHWNNIIVPVIDWYEKLLPINQEVCLSDDIPDNVGVSDSYWTIQCEIPGQGIGSQSPCPPLPSHTLTLI